MGRLTFLSLPWRRDVLVSFTVSQRELWARNFNYKTTTKIIKLNSFQTMCVPCISSHVHILHFRLSILYFKPWVHPTFLGHMCTLHLKLCVLPTFQGMYISYISRHVYTPIVVFYLNFLVFLKFLYTCQSSYTYFYDYDYFYTDDFRYTFIILNFKNIES